MARSPYAPAAADGERSLRQAAFMAERIPGGVGGERGRRKTPVFTHWMRENFPWHYPFPV